MEKGCADCQNCTLSKFASVSAVISWGQTLAASKEISDAEMNDWLNYCDQGETLYLREGALVKPTFAVPNYGAGGIFVAQKNGVISPFSSSQAFWRLGYDISSLLKVNENEFFSSFTSFGKGISEEMVLSCGQKFDLEDESITNPAPLCLEGELFESYSGAWNTKNVGECQSEVQECSNNQWLVIQEEKLPIVEVFDGLDNDCDSQTDEGLTQPVLPSTDKDDDGYTVEEGDCDDNNPYVQPDAEEMCDDLDNDCNGETDENLYQYCETICGSGESQCDFGKWSICDIEDFNPELCDGWDNDCDGQIDEGCPPVCLPMVEICDGVDNDCDGLIDEGVKNACGKCGVVPQETCDGQDNDCDGQIDEGCLIDPPSEFISCSISCPENMLAYAWWGSFGTANSWGSLSLAISKSELCQRGQPWVDFNCTKQGWTYFDPLLAEIDCNHQFTSGLGTIDFGGEGEIWFTDFSCSD
jgi:hypothetical protein